MSVTQKDIARGLGISPSLVSRALRGTAVHIGAAEETVQRIRREAQRLGYRSSAAALTLRGEPTQTLGIVVKDFEDPYFGLLIGELQRVAAAAGLSLVLTGCDGGRLDAAALTKYQVDGLIVVGSEIEPEGLETFFDGGTPVVQIGSGRKRPGMARVCMEQAVGLGKLLDHLASLGHREIGYLGDGTPASRRRSAVLKQEMRRRELAVRGPWFVDADHAGPEAGETAAARLLGGGVAEMPTALVAADDVLAQGAMRALFERGCRVPDDVSLAGVDDIPSARMMIPSLTTLRQPMAEMVRQAFTLVTQGGPGLSGRVVDVPPELVIRESCGAPAKRRRS